MCVCVSALHVLHRGTPLRQELCKHGIDSSNIVVNQARAAKAGNLVQRLEGALRSGQYTQGLSGTLQAYPFSGLSCNLTFDMRVSKGEGLYGRRH